MADRKQSFSFLRQARGAALATQTPSPPPATTNSNTAARPTTRSVSRKPTTTTNHTSITPPTSETRAPSPQPATTYSAPVGVQSTGTINPTSPLPSEFRTIGQPTKSPSSSEPASSSRGPPRSKSPPQPSSPQTPSSTPNGRQPNGVDNETNRVDETSFKHNEVKAMPSKSTGNIPTGELKTPTSNGGHEALVELREVSQQATKNEGKKVAKNAVDDFLNRNPGSEAPITGQFDIPSQPGEEVVKNRSTNPGVHDKSAKKNGEQVSSFGDPKNAVRDRNISIVTLAGENRGASMQMGPSNLREGPVHINRGYEVKPDGKGSCNRTQQFGNADAKEYREVYVNNNVQGINNSVVFNASIREGNPGVHMVVTRVPNGPVHREEVMSSLETRKAEFNISRAEKRTYEPTVRRRCLRGLLMEKNDSDPENPDEPGRHGCRKENENNVGTP